MTVPCCAVVRISFVEFRTQANRFCVLAVITTAAELATVALQTVQRQWHHSSSSNLGSYQQSY
jgi:hypothetical protein